MRKNRHHAGSDVRRQKLHEPATFPFIHYCKLNLIFGFQSESFPKLHISNSMWAILQTEKLYQLMKNNPQMNWSWKHWLLQPRGLGNYETRVKQSLSAHLSAALLVLWLRHDARHCHDIGKLSDQRPAYVQYQQALYEAVTQRQIIDIWINVMQAIISFL